MCDNDIYLWQICVLVRDVAHALVMVMVMTLTWCV